MNTFCKLTPIFILSMISSGGVASQRISQTDFLALVKSNNLNLTLELAASDAAKSDAAGIMLPPPMIGITRLNDKSGSAIGFEVNQTLPFPSKLSNDQSARESSFAASKQKLKVTERDLLSEAKLAYFRLWQSEEKLTILRDKKMALEGHVKLSRAAVRSDSFLKLHVVKAESDLDLLENEIIQAELLVRENQILAAELSHRDPVSFLPLAEPVPISALPALDYLRTPFLLQAKRFELETFRSRELVARASWLPDFNFRYRQMGGTDLNPRYSEFMVGVSLPFVYFWESKSISGKASAERMKSEIELEKEKVRIDSRLTFLVAKANSLRQQLELFKEKLFPRAEQRSQLVHNLALRDIETLQDHREVMETVPDLKLKALEIRAMYEETVFELEKFISGDSK